MDTSIRGIPKKEVKRMRKIRPKSVYGRIFAQNCFLCKRQVLKFYREYLKGMTLVIKMKDLNVLVCEVSETFYLCHRCRSETVYLPQLPIKVLSIVYCKNEEEQTDKFVEELEKGRGML